MVLGPYAPVFVPWPFLLVEIWAHSVVMACICAGYILHGDQGWPACALLAQLSVHWLCICAGKGHFLFAPSHQWANRALYGANRAVHRDQQNRVQGQQSHVQGQQTHGQANLTQNTQGTDWGFNSSNTDFLLETWLLPPNRFLLPNFTLSFRFGLLSLGII